MSASKRSLEGVKAVHMPTLLELLRLGAKDQPVEISTIDLARRLRRSQQVISRHLLDLEREGYVERVRGANKGYVRMREKGISAVMELYSDLKGALEGAPRVVELRGELFTGLDEGAYYVSRPGYRRQFIKKLGWEPYPGTLNLRLTTPRDRRLRGELKQQPAIFIEGFKDEQRSYGWVRCLPALINGRVEGAVLSSFERTHYDDTVLEIIAPAKIKEGLRLKDGAVVNVKVFLARGGAKEIRGP